VLQCVAVCCSAVYCVVFCSTNIQVACDKGLLCVCVVVRCSALQCVAVRCSALQHKHVGGRG